MGDCINCSLIPFGNGSSPALLFNGAYTSIADKKAMKAAYTKLTNNFSTQKGYQCICSDGYKWDTASLRCRNIFI